MPVVVPYRQEDEFRCQNLLREIFGDDTVSSQYYRLSPKAGTVVARDMGYIAGIGSIWHNTLHPYSMRCAVAVHPNHRRRGIGEMLLQAIARCDDQGLPMITSFWETQIEGQRFAWRHGFREIRRTYITSLQLTSLNLETYHPWVENLTNEGYRIIPISNITGDARQKISRLCQDVYVATHRDNPPAELSVTQWTDRVFVEDLIPQGSFIVRYQSEDIAVALLHRSKSKHAVELGWRGVTHAHRLKDRMLMMATAVLQAEYAVSHNAQLMLLECDSTDPWSTYLLNAFPFLPAPAWITWKRES